MKKSELLKLLELDIEDTKNSGVEFQARMVLARCISVGMLPPDNVTSNEPTNIWDDEDETE